MATAALLWSVVSSTVSASGYVAILLVAYVLVVRPDRRTLMATLWPADPDRRMLVVLFAVPLLLPFVVLPLSGIKFSALWTLPAWFLLPVVLLAPPEAAVKRLDAVRVAFVVLCVSLAVLAASPAVAWARFVEEQAKPRAHFAAVSQELTRAWRRAVKQPLAIVASSTDFANAAAFYSGDHPKSWDLGDPQLTPWIAEDRRAARRLGRGLSGRRAGLRLAREARGRAGDGRDPPGVRARRRVSRPARPAGAIRLRAGPAKRVGRGVVPGAQRLGAHRGGGTDGYSGLDSNRLCGFMSKPVHIVDAVPQNVRAGVKVPSSSRKVCSSVDISQTVVSVFWIDSLLM